MKRAEEEFKAPDRHHPTEVGKYTTTLEFYSMKRKEDPLLDAYMKEYEAFFGAGQLWQVRQICEVASLIQRPATGRPPGRPDVRE